MRVHKPVRQFTKKGRFIRQFESPQEAAKAVGYNEKTIRRACLGYKSCSMYIWKYVEHVTGQYGDERVVTVLHNSVTREIKVARKGWVEISHGLWTQGTTTDKGYLRVGLQFGNKSKFFSVHVLVARAFIGERTVVRQSPNHIDGNKTNNDASNLEWATQKQQVEHSIKTGLRFATRVQRINPDTKEIEEQFNSLNDAAKKCAMSENTIKRHAKAGTEFKGFWKIIPNQKWDPRFALKDNTNNEDSSLDDEHDKDDQEKGEDISITPTPELSKKRPREEDSFADKSSKRLAHE